MIDKVLAEVVNKLNKYIHVTEPDFVLGNIALIDAYHDSSATTNDKVIASVINIEQEKSLRNLPYRKTVDNPDGTKRGVEREPDIYLNVYLLFGSNKKNYKTGLLRISQVISFFQNKFIYMPGDFPEAVSMNVDKLIFDIYSTSFDELSQIWSVMGGKYVPSVMYKMRMAMIQDPKENDTGIIKEIHLNSGNLAT